MYRNHSTLSPETSIMDDSPVLTVSLSEAIFEKLKIYFEDLADKVENDTLTFKEGFAIVASGAVVTQLFILISSLL